MKRRLGFGLGLGSDAGRVSVDVVWRVVREGFEGFASERVEMVVALDFLRFIGQDGSSEDVSGGGGSGEELISPMRRSVRVNWAFVGTPSRRVLFGVSMDGW